MRNRQVEIGAVLAPRKQQTTTRHPGRQSARCRPAEQQHHLSIGSPIETPLLARANAGKSDPAGIPRRIDADSGRHRHLAPLVASTIDAGTEDWSQRGQSSVAAQTARAAEVNMSDYWTPDAESYFGRITKAQMRKRCVRQREQRGHSMRMAKKRTSLPPQRDGSRAQVGCRASYGCHR